MTDRNDADAGAADQEAAVRRDAQAVYRLLDDEDYRPSALRRDERRGGFMMWINDGPRLTALARTVGRYMSARKWMAFVRWDGETGERSVRVRHARGREPEIEQALAGWLQGVAPAPIASGASADGEAEGQADAAPSP